MTSDSSPGAEHIQALRSLRIDPSARGDGDGRPASSDGGGAPATVDRRLPSGDRSRPRSGDSGSAAGDSGSAAGDSLPRGGAGPVPGPRPRRRRLVLAGATVALLLLGGALLLLARQRPGWAPLAGLSMPEVDTATLLAAGTPRPEVLFVASGYIEPLRRATVGPRSGGRLGTSRIREGLEVTEGELLATLDDADARAALLLARREAAVAAARRERVRVDLEDAQRQWQRERALHLAQVSTGQAFDGARARIEGAQAQLRIAAQEQAAARARVVAADVLLESTRIRAPFSGRITQKLLDTGDLVPAGSAGIAVLVDFTSLVVEADVNEAQLARLGPRAPAEIALDAFGDRRFAGQVHEVRPRVDRAKGTVVVRVAFRSLVPGVLPDMAAKVTFLAGPAAGPPVRQGAATVLAPADAVIERREGSQHAQVLALGPAGQVVAHRVRVMGSAPGGLVELDGGPPAGTSVIRRPPPTLRPGVQVRSRN